jgi:hypothetical protein
MIIKIIIKEEELINIYKKDKEIYELEEIFNDFECLINFDCNCQKFEEPENTEIKEELKFLKNKKMIKTIQNPDKIFILNEIGETNISFYFEFESLEIKKIKTYLYLFINNEKNENLDLIYLEHLVIEKKKIESRIKQINFEKQKIDDESMDNIIKTFEGIDISSLFDKLEHKNISNDKNFYDLDDFPELKIIEESYDIILKEFLNVIQEDSLFVPPGITLPIKTIQKTWKQLWLLMGDTIHKENCKIFPKTVEILKKCKRIRREVLFSVMEPNCYIPPHRGNMNTALRVHMGLCGLGNCGIKVGDETRKQEEGKLLIFDDSKIHSAWNGSDEQRCVLIFDIIHPELSEENYDKICEDFFEETRETNSRKLLDNHINSVLGTLDYLKN